jgi:acetyl-CoA synthetase
MISSLPGLTGIKPGSVTRAPPGVSAELFDDAGGEIEQGCGVPVLTQAWPGMLRTLPQDPDRFVQTYFSRFGPRNYFVGDGARRDEGGYYWITGRIDDVIMVSGHRPSAAGVESALAAHPLVTEAAVIAVSDELTGQSIVAYVMLRTGTSAEPALKDAQRQHVAERIGKRARPKRIIWADDVPKTRFGKIVCRLLRDIAEGRNPGDAATLRDPSVLAKLQQATTQDDSESAGAPETGNTR